MMLGNFGAFLLAPLLASSSFMGFGASDGNSYFKGNSSNNWWGNVAQAQESRGNDNWGWWGNRSPRISDINPDEGPVGTEITLKGSRFTDESVVRFGEGAIHDVDASNNGRTLTFTLPDYMGQYCPPDEVCIQIAHEVEPGEYDVSVVTGERTSNSVDFTVTEDGEEPSDGMVIDSIDGPNALEVDAEGTWTVNVSGAESDLSYSVKWGDEGIVARSMMAMLDEGQASATFTHTYGDAGTYTPEFTVTDADGNEVSKQAAKVTVGDDGTIHVDAILPTSATAGSKITLTGHGFDGDTKVWVGRTAASDVEVESDTALTFTIPAVAAGTHRITVVSDEGRSNQVDLKVEKTVKGKVSVNGVSAPSRLSVDEEGTWTVNATSNLEGNLSYSVDWGEGNMMARSSQSGVETQSSATFTHSYATEGTYHPKFTVTDEKGNKASVSASVVVR